MDPRPSSLAPLPSSVPDSSIPDSLPGVWPGCRRVGGEDKKKIKTYFQEHKLSKQHKSQSMLCPPYENHWLGNLFEVLTWQILCRLYGSTYTAYFVPSFAYTFKKVAL